MFAGGCPAESLLEDRTEKMPESAENTEAAEQPEGAVYMPSGSLQPSNTHSHFICSQLIFIISCHFHLI